MEPDDTFGLFNYMDYEEWEECEYYEEDDLESLEDAEKRISLRKESDDAGEQDLLGYAKKLEEKRSKILETKAKAKQKEIQLLIDVAQAGKEEDDVSEETVITPEEGDVFSVISSTESSVHPCLRHVDISDSRLQLSNLHTMYPVPDDPGLSQAFWTISEPPPTYEGDGIQKFIDLTKKSRLRPIESLKEMLITDKVNLQYYGIDSRVLRALSEALANNTSVHTLNLKDNWLSADACYHISQLLCKNNILHTLILKGCRIGSAGVAKLREGLSENDSLKMLDLSGCNIRKEGFANVTNAVCENWRLEHLILNDNDLDESCSEDLQRLISDTQNLRQLDLSWNSLYAAATWKMLVKGLEKTERVINLDLSWNSLDHECVPYLGQMLSGSLPVEKLNLADNQFNEIDSTPIAKHLAKNTVLQELYLDNNPLKPAGALNLIRAVNPKSSPESNLRILSLTNIWAKKDVLPELEEIKNDRPSLDVRLGGILSNHKIIGPDVRKLFLRRANFEAMKPKKKKLQRNFGHFILSLTDTHIPRSAFVELVKKFRLKLSESLIKEIMNAFPGPKNTVDQEHMKSFYLEQYPDTTPAPEKVVKEKKAKKEKSEKKPGKGKTVKKAKK